MVPKSHIEQVAYEHHTADSQRVVLTQYIPEGILSEMERAVDVELEPGQFSLHDVYTANQIQPMPLMLLIT